MISSTEQSGTDTERTVVDSQGHHNNIPITTTPTPTSVVHSSLEISTPTEARHIPLDGVPSPGTISGSSSSDVVKVESTLPGKEEMLIKSQDPGAIAGLANFLFTVSHPLTHPQSLSTILSFLVFLQQSFVTDSGCQGITQNRRNSRNAFFCSFFLGRSRRKEKANILPRRKRSKSRHNEKSPMYALQL